MSTPTAFFDVAQLALDCVCTSMDEVAELVEGYNGCPCRAYVSAGSPAFDNCCTACDDSDNHGQLTVQLGDVFQSDNFPTTSTFIHPCKAASWVAQIIVTVARCDPSQDEQGTPPTDAELSASAEQLAIDLWAVVRGLTCCLTAEAVPGKSKRRVALANVGNTTIPGEGGCVGIEVRAFVEIGSVCGCEPESS